MKTLADRLVFILKQFGYNRKKGLLAARININSSRFSRILGGAPMYDYELTALVHYFPGLTYEWLLEGRRPTEELSQSIYSLYIHMQEMTPEARMELVELLRKQGD
ncbi:MAG: hypothetical protein RPT25_02535 [Cycloclasticus sp.]